MSLVEKAEALARKYHEGQLYDGKDYVNTHVADVARRVAADPSATDVHVAVAWLHDTLEDTKISAAEIFSLFHTPDFSTFLGVDAVVRLTHYKDETYEEYMAQLVKSPIAALVKYHDSAANYAYGARPKYKKNLDFLLDFLPEASVEYLKNSS